MFRKLQAQWHDIAKGEPGKRFQRRFERRQKERCGVLSKALYMVAGVALLIAGLVLMPAPGPGIVVVLLGAALVGQESLWAARALDRIELAARALVEGALRAWKRASTAVRTGVVALGTALAAALGWGAYMVLAS